MHHDTVNSLRHNRLGLREVETQAIRFDGWIDLGKGVLEEACKAMLN